MQVPVKKIPMQMLLYGLMVVLTINSVMTKVAAITWFVYVSLGLTVLVVVAMIILSRKPDDSMYTPNEKKDKMHSAFLMIFLIIYLITMIVRNEAENNEGIQSIIANNYYLIQWIAAGLMLAVAIVGIVMKALEYKEIHSKE